MPPLTGRLPPRPTRRTAPKPELDGENIWEWRLLRRWAPPTEDPSYVSRELLEEIMERYRKSRPRLLFDDEPEPAEDRRDWRKTAFWVIREFAESRGMDMRHVEWCLFPLPLRKPEWNHHASRWEDELVTMPQIVLAAEPKRIRAQFMLTERVMERLKPWCEDYLLASSCRREMFNQRPANPGDPGFFLPLGISRPMLWDPDGLLKNPPR